MKSKNGRTISSITSRGYMLLLWVVSESSMDAQSSGELLQLLGAKSMVVLWHQVGAKQVAGDCPHNSESHASGSSITWVIIRELNRTSV